MGWIRECVVCKVLPLVLQLYGEEDDRCEITNLSATEGPSATNESLVVKIFDPPDCGPEEISRSVEKSLPSIVAIPMGCAKLIEGAETHKWVVPFLLLVILSRLWPE